MSAVIFGIQSCEMRGQLDAMNDQAAITKAQIRADLRFEQLIITANQGGWFVNPILKNSGGTDAEHVYSQWAITYTGTNIPSKSDCPGMAEWPPNFPVNASVGPSDSISLFAKTLFSQDVENTVKNKGFIFVAGDFTYKDVFASDGTRTTRWCVQVIPNDPAHDVFSVVTVQNQND